MRASRPTASKHHKSRPVKFKPTAKKKKYSPYRMRVPQTLWLVPIVIILGFGSVFCFFAAQELRTSTIQADYMSRLASEINFSIKDGPNTEFRVPTFGPYNQRLGYSYMPFFVKALEASDYTVNQQVRTSPRYQYLLKHGLYPIYRAKTSAGLTLMDSTDQPLYNASYPSHIFPDFRSIPPLLVNTLLHIENRELLRDGPITRNPVVEWDRFFYAVLGHFVQYFAPGFNVGGGSTLATQIEKFRYSPGGQTTNAADKIRQIASASMRVYLDGPDTRAAREHIVLDYMNSTPLSARPGFGEVNSIGDGLWAWFGRDINETITALNLPETDYDSLRAKASVYREALGLILAQRRPTYYLLSNREALNDLTNATLDRLASEGVISQQLRTYTKSAQFNFLAAPPPQSQSSFLDQKAANAMRNHLLTLLGLKNLYELDRVDLKAVSTMNQSAQIKVTEFLKKMGNADFVKSIGMFGFRLLNPENDPSKIKWSVVLYEKCDDGNKLRIQSDNIDGPFDMNEGVKLDLGSTAKLRTLITYLEIISELHRRYAGLAQEDLRDLAEEAPDTLTNWATTWLASNPNANLKGMLNAAMERKYSGSPYETFFTGGGAHTFVNFEKSEDGRIMDMHEALRDSVNLVFIRLMRDIVNYTIAQGQQTKQELMSDPDLPARKDYLERFADKEGTTFLNRYINDFANLSSDEALEKITARARKGATSRTILFRSLRPNASFKEFVAFMQSHLTVELEGERLAKLYKEYPADRYSLSDRAYITGIHPLELWLLGYKQSNPNASRSDILAVSKPIRIESYAWLFRARLKGAQDTRIRILLEQDAFARIRERWARLGYPFEKLVPSFATAIGSSADRPGALAELVGILLNDGVRKPNLRFERLHFAQNTPYETVLSPAGIKAVQVLDPEITRIVRSAMAEVVENGTAKRLAGAYTDADGKPLKIGGKTGTGDHRFDEFGAGGRLISSRVVNRTGTIAFYIGDKFFGTVTAHVSGEEAGNYKFTSALSAQMLKSMSPILQPLITPDKKIEEVIPQKTKTEKLQSPEPDEGAAEEGDNVEEEEDQQQ